MSTLNLSTCAGHAGTAGRVQIHAREEFVRTGEEACVNMTQTAESGRVRVTDFWLPDCVNPWSTYRVAGERTDGS
jgi:hypothetical protein